MSFLDVCLCSLGWACLCSLRTFGFSLVHEISIDQKTKAAFLWWGVWFYLRISLMLCIADQAFLLIRDEDRGSHLGAFLRGLLDSNSEHILNLDFLGTGFRSVGGLTNLVLVVWRLSIIMLVYGSWEYLGVLLGCVWVLKMVSGVLSPQGFGNVSVVVPDSLCALLFVSQMLSGVFNV